ncbi:MAG: SurA N-terminal domain-containing protein [Spirochaetes bacterium]|nr:SurA N-terminal domain-containing protein [Spirochaetota bacterium]MBU1081036.1 SurA N-terminal domain-containing protein [Spirochaetota bacterium]
MASSNDKHVRPEASDTRHRGNSFIYIGTVILLIITVLAFVFVPAMGGSMDGSDELTFGSWNNKPISFVQGGYFSSQVQQVKAQYESQGIKDTGDQFFAYRVWQRAFENTAVHLALLDYAQRAGISVSESFIDARMIENQAFMDNGVFSKRKYREATNSAKIALRKEIETSALKGRYVTDSVSYIASKAETGFLKAIAQSQRVVEYVAVPFSAYPDEERFAFASANPAAFKRLALSQITVSSSKKEAEQVKAKVGSGSLSFDEAAKAHSKDDFASKGGNAGARYAWEIKSDLKEASDFEALQSLGKGEVSPVFETLVGSWVFYRVDEASADPDLGSADLAKNVTKYLNRNEKGRIEDWVVAKASEFAAAASSDFKAAATAKGYEVKETQPFPLNYGKALDIGYFSLLGSLDATDLPELRGADTSERFLSAAFSLEAGQVSKPVVLNDFAIVLRVKEIKNADEGDMGLLEAYYPTVVQQNASRELAAAILASPSLKDDFIAAFSRAYSQTN